jgi:peroxiredoxin
VKEIPHFNKLFKEYSEKGLVVLGVSLDNGGAQKVIDFKANRVPISYPVVMGDRETGGVYQNYLPQYERGGIPFTFVIDREGIIRHHFVGYRDMEVFVEANKHLQQI